LIKKKKCRKCSVVSSTHSVHPLSVDVPVKLWPHISIVYCCWLYSLAASINIVPVTIATLFRGRIVIYQLQCFIHLNHKRAFKLGRREGRSWDGDDDAIPLIHSTSFLSDRPPGHVLRSDYYGLARLGYSWQESIQVRISHINY